MAGQKRAEVPKPDEPLKPFKHAAVAKEPAKPLQAGMLAKLAEVSKAFMAAKPPQNVSDASSLPKDAEPLPMPYTMQTILDELRGRSRLAVFTPAASPKRMPTVIAEVAASFRNKMAQLGVEQKKAIGTQTTNTSSSSPP